MATFPPREEQVRNMHALLIHQVVKACQNAEERPMLEQLLAQAEVNKWADLVDTIRSIVKGKRDTSLLKGLDEEDTVIVRSILAGLQDPTSLPAIDQQADPKMAAPGIARVIHEARRGDTEALQVAAFLANQMTQSHGDMMYMGGIMRKLIDGERDVEKLQEGMTESGQKLVQDMLDELRNLEH